MYSDQIAVARKEWKRSQDLYGDHLSRMRQQSKRSGFALGAAATAASEVRRQYDRRELRAAGVAAVRRNLLARRALVERADAEAYRYGALYRSVATAAHRRSLAMWLLAESRQRQRQPSADAAAAAAAMLEAARDLGETSDAVIATVGKHPIEAPDAISIRRTAKISKMVGIAFDHPGVDAAEEIAKGYDLPGPRQSQRILDFMPGVVHLDVRSALDGLEGMLAADLGTTVTIREQSGETRTVNAESVSSEPSCDWLCQVGRAFKTVGPAVGVGAATAGVAVAKNNPTAGALLAGAGGLFAGLGATLGGGFAEAFGLGKKEGKTTTEASVGFPWIPAVALGGIAAAVGFAAWRRA